MNQAIRHLLGENAKHVPCWMYVQDQGEGLISFVGASSVKDGIHPLRYGSQRTHQLIVGEMVARPHFVIATDALRGSGLAGLVGGHQIDELLAHGEYVIERQS